MPTQTSHKQPAKQGVEAIREALKTIPSNPGVYRMINQADEVLYVGKARNLKKRVQSYTRPTGHTNRIARMIFETTHMEIVTTASESDALLLEANLIKKLKPPFNVIMRDDKSFPYILLARDHDVTQIVKHRGAHTRKGEYFGPFASPGAVNRTITALQKAFLIRSCSDAVYNNRTRPCLLYQIKRCAAPCTNEIAPDAYDKLVTEAQEFLAGKSDKVKGAMAHNMEQAADELDYERAAFYRDRIGALSQIQAHQGINPHTVKEADVFAAYGEGRQVCIQVFFFRAGQNWGNRAYFPRADKELSEAQVLEAFLTQFYDNKPAPKLILLSHGIENRTLIAEAFSLKADYKINVDVPKRGEKRELIEHARTNAKQALERRTAQSETERALLEGLAAVFNLEAAPKRIEVYDNSHIQGAHAVGAMIVSGQGGFQKNQYRKFNMDDVDTKSDDYEMMRKMLTRRFSRLLREDNDRKAQAKAQARDGRSPWPDLVLIDGGAGQLTAATEIMEELGLSDIPLVAIAKGPDRDAGRETFYMKGRKSFKLEPRDPILYFLQRLRDESHRFVIGAHRTRRKKDITRSGLDEIDGIGPGRKRALLHHFGSARGVGRAGITDLEAVDGVSKAMAKRIFDYFHDQTN